MATIHKYVQDAMDEYMNNYLEIVSYEDVRQLVKDAVADAMTDAYRDAARVAEQHSNPAIAMVLHHRSIHCSLALSIAESEV